MDTSYLSDSHTAIINIDLFKRIQAMETKLDRLVGQLQRAYQGEAGEMIEQKLCEAKAKSRRQTFK